MKEVRFIPVSMQAAPKHLWIVVYGGSVLSHSGLESLWVRFIPRQVHLGLLESTCDKPVCVCVCVCVYVLVCVCVVCVCGVCVWCVCVYVWCVCVRGVYTVYGKTK